jgi:hypothetical protein
MNKSYSTHDRGNLFSEAGVVNYMIQASRIFTGKIIKMSHFQKYIFVFMIYSGYIL